jgi:hypothetical protein
MSLRRKVGLAVLGFLLALAFYVGSRLREPPPGPQGEVIGPDEDRYTAGIIASAIAQIEAAQVPGEAHHRDVHAKAHGCVKATIETRDSDPRLRFGLFAERKPYRAWIRFSNGSTKPQPDRTRDARGFALKVMGLPGEKLLADERNAETQDFLMINSRVLLVRTLADYAAFMDDLGRGRFLAWFLGGPSLDPRRWHPRELALAIQTLKPAPRSPLDLQYHSLSAYALGPDLFVKYSARPCAGWEGKGGRPSGDDFLRAALRADLQGGEGCFDLLVQPQVTGKNMPVEDASIEWRAEDSPFLEVARVTIPRQDFDTPAQNAFCEALSFTPWHALPAHRPAGALNRVRRAVYEGVSRYRHEKNGIAQAEPRGWCLELSGQACPEG